jgi:Cytochrome c3
MKHSGPRNKVLHESNSTIPVSLESAPRTSHPATIPAAGRRRRAGVVTGLCLAAAALGFFLYPGFEHLTAPGRMNAGHEKVSCVSCHQRAPGTVRQQLQADARYLLGLREAPADFGLRGVSNDDCLACHERPFDRHPAFRFTEPRFAEARQTLAPHQCASCHREHSGARVTAPAGYCVGCHDTLEMKNDPLNVPHVELVRQGRWLTCLGCHDFHGNHVMDSRTRVADDLAARHVQRYFEGGVSPYPSQLRLPPRTQRADRGD